MSSQELPETHRALVLTSTSSPPEIKTLPTPQPTPGSAIVRILAANIISYSKHIYNGTRPYPFPLPMIPGTSALGRIAAAGPDAVLLELGKLVWIDSFVRARDDPNAAFLLGVHQGHSQSSKKLMQGEWRDATYAEYAKIPLECCYPINEEKMSEFGYGYGIEELADISRLMVPYGGLSSISLRPGETIIIAPATGSFGSAAVKLSLAMGARVIALGRSSSTLSSLAKKYSSPRLSIVQTTGDVATDLKSLQNYGTIDVFFDISPPEAAGSTHFKSCILSLRKGGRVCLMGGLNDDLSIPVKAVMSRDLTIKGKWMYERSDVRELIQMIEVGVLKLDGLKIEKFGLEDWARGFDAATEKAGSEGMAVICP